MAYTKIKVINDDNHLYRANNYAMHEEKTTVYDDLNRMVDYATDITKTVAGVRLVSCLNCFPETATQKMIQTKREFGKEDGRKAYHIIQSFMPGEVTPELAHKISVEYAERWLSDFEVVIGTHTDRAHIHAHIVVNSVSCVTGNKFHLSTGEFYEKLRGISDELCEKYGLSVIQRSDERHMTYSHYLLRHGKGVRSLRQLATEDTIDCIHQSNTVGEVYTRLETLGYDVVLKGKYAKLRPPEGEKYWRFATLGFQPEEIQRRIDGRGKLEVFREKRRFRSRRRFPKVKLSRFQALYLYYLYLMDGVRKRPGRRASHYRHEIGRAMEKCKKQLQFITHHGITKISQVEQMKREAESKMLALQEVRKGLNAQKRRLRPLFNAYHTYARYRDIIDKKELDRESRQDFNYAVRYLESKGFAEDKDAVIEARAHLLGEVEKNRSEIQQCKEQLGMFRAIQSTYRDIDDRLRHEFQTKDGRTQEHDEKEKKHNPKEK